MRNSQDILTKLSKNNKIVSDGWPLALTPNGRQDLYAISNPVIMTDHSRIYLMIYKKIIYNTFYSHKRSVNEIFTCDIRVWKLDKYQGFWLPTKNGLNIEVNILPGLLITAQKFFDFFIELIRKEI